MTQEELAELTRQNREAAERQHEEERLNKGRDELDTLFDPRRQFFRDGQGTIRVGTEGRADDWTSLAGDRMVDSSGREYRIAPNEHEAFYKAAKERGIDVKPMERMALRWKHGIARDEWVNPFDTKHVEALKKEGYVSYEDANAQKSALEYALDPDTYIEGFSNPDTWKDLPKNIVKGTGTAAYSVGTGFAKFIADSALDAAGTVSRIATLGNDGDWQANARAGLESGFKAADDWVAENVWGASSEKEKEAVGLGMGAGKVYGEMGVGLGAVAKIGKWAPAALFALQGFERTEEDPGIAKAGWKGDIVAVANAVAGAAAGPIITKLAGAVGAEPAKAALERTFAESFMRSIGESIHGGAVMGFMEAVNQGGRGIADIEEVVTDENGNQLYDDDGNPVFRKVSAKERVASTLNAFAHGTATIGMLKAFDLGGKLAYPATKRAAEYLGFKRAVSYEVEQARKDYAPKLAKMAETARQFAQVGAPLPQGKGKIGETIKGVTTNGEVVFADGSVYYPPRAERVVAGESSQTSRVIPPREARIVVSDGTILDVNGNVVGIAASGQKLYNDAETIAETYARRTDPSAEAAFTTINPETGAAGPLNFMDFAPEKYRQYVEWMKGGQKGEPPELDADSFLYSRIVALAKGAQGDDLANAAQLALGDIAGGRATVREAIEGLDAAETSFNGKGGRRVATEGFEELLAAPPSETSGDSAQTKAAKLTPVVEGEIRATSPVEDGVNLAHAAIKLVDLSTENGIVPEDVDITGIALPEGQRYQVAGEGAGKATSETPIFLWQNPESGKLEVVDGGRRLSAEVAAGAKTVKAVVLRPEDGWKTREDADAVAAVANIRSGSLDDVALVDAFARLGLNEADAAEAGLVPVVERPATGPDQAYNDAMQRKATVRLALEVANHASPEVRGLVAPDNLSSIAAVARAVNAETFGQGWEKVQAELAKRAGGASVAETRAAAELCANFAEAIAKGRVTAEELFEAARSAASMGREMPTDEAGLRALQEAAANDAASKVPVEGADGRMTTLADAISEAKKVAPVEDPPPAGTGTAAELAIRDKGNGLKLVSVGTTEDGLPIIGCAAFPELRMTRVREADPAKGRTVFVSGLTLDDFTDAHKSYQLAKFLGELGERLGGEGVTVRFEEWMKPHVERLMDFYDSEIVTSKAYETRRDAVIKVLEKSGLAAGVVVDEAAFDAALAANGRRELVVDGLTYGFADPDTGKIYLNPRFFGKRIGLETPIHEFGHLGIIACRSVNRAVFERGMKLALQTDLFKEISKHPDYGKLSEAERAEEVLAQLIGKRGAERLKAETNKGVVAEIKKWIVDFWHSFAKALGLRDITPEQAAKMSIEDVVDAINAEMMSGRTFGSKPLDLVAGDARAKIERFMKYKPGKDGRDTPRAKAAFSEVKAAWKDLDAFQKAALAAHGGADPNGGAALSTPAAKTWAKAIDGLREWDAWRKRRSKSTKEQMRRNPSAAQKQIVRAARDFYVENHEADPHSPFAFFVTEGARMLIPGKGDYGFDWWNNMQNGLKAHERKELKRFLAGEGYGSKKGGNDTLVREWLEWRLGRMPTPEEEMNAPSFEEFMDAVMAGEADYQAWKRTGKLDTRADREAREMEEYEELQRYRERRDLDTIAAQQDADRREMERMGDFESERPSRESDYYWNNTDFSRRLRFARRSMTALAKAKVGDSVEGVTADSLRNAIEKRIEDGLAAKEYRFKTPRDRKRLVAEAVKFYKRFSQKTVMLSDGRCVYFVPDARAKGERGLPNDEAWAEYAIHAVTSSGQKIEGKDYNERLFNKTKAANIWRIENILKAERCELQEATEDRSMGIAFYGRGVDGKTIKIITRLDEANNIYADLSEVTVVNGRKKGELPPRKPLAEVVGAAQYRGGLPTGDNDIVSNPQAKSQGRIKLSRSGIFTGTAADYANRSRQGGVDDGPSLLKIGTGEGTQVYGWGLYGSTVRGVAEGYAKRGIVETTINGKKIDINRIDLRETPEGVIADNARSLVVKGKEASRSALISEIGGSYEEYARRAEDTTKWNHKNLVALAERYKAALQILEDKANVIDVKSPGNLYEQTFFTDRAPGDESHLLKWYEPVSKEQKQWIADELNKSIDDPKMKWVVTENGLKPNNKYAIESKFKTGQEAYQFATIQAAVLAKSKNGREYPRLASEFLARAGIDGIKYPVDSYGGKGVKDGDKAGWNYVSFRDDNIRVDHKWTDGQMKYSRRLFKFGNANVGMAPETAAGETTPGARAANRQRMAEERDPGRALWQVPWHLNPNGPGGAPIQKPLALGVAETVRLVEALTGKSPTSFRRTKTGKNAEDSWTSKGRIGIAKDMLRVLDEGDAAKIREKMISEGYFKAESDPVWSMVATPDELEADRTTSDSVFANRMRSTYIGRVNGTIPGGMRGATQLMANEVGRVIMMLPADTGAVGRGIRTLGQGIIADFSGKGKNASKFNYMMQEAADWFNYVYGKPVDAQGNPRFTAATVGAKENLRGTVGEMIGWFLTSSDEMSRRAPATYKNMLDAIEHNKKLKHALDDIRQTALGEGAAEHAMQRVERTKTRQYEKMVDDLEREINTPIGTFGERLRDSFVYNWSNMDGPMYLHMSAAQKARLKGYKTMLKAGKITQQEYDTLVDRDRQAIQSVKLAQLAADRGVANEIRMHLWDVNYVFQEAKAAGVDMRELDRYMVAQRSIETGGRSGEGEFQDPHLAHQSLADQRKRLGARGFKLLEETAAKFYAARERNILEDARLVQAFGKEMVDYWKDNVHYIRTERTLSPEDLARIEANRAKFKATHGKTSDDVIEAVMDAGRQLRQASGGTSGFTTWTKALEGSFRPTKDWKLATAENDLRLMKFMERNDYVIKMRDALTALGVEGVHDFAEGDRHIPGSYNERYGVIRYVENGKRRALVVPKIIERGYAKEENSMDGWGSIGKAAHGVFIDWNFAYTLRNFTRNIHSNQANLAGMHTDNVSMASRWVLPGVSQLAEIGMTQLARHLPDYVFRNKFMRTLFGQNTNLYYAGQAQRILELYLSPKKAVERQRAADEAAKKGDLAPAATLAEDMKALRFCLKGGALISRFDAVRGGGAADDFMQSHGLDRMVSGEVKKGSVLGRILSAPFRTNAEVNRDLELWAKITATLQQAAHDPGASPQEIGMRVAEGASIPRYESRGSQSRFINYAWNMFFNTALQGTLRHIRAVKTRPGETLGKMAAQSIGPRVFWGAMIMGGGLSAIIKWIFDGDEEKARESSLGGLMDGCNKLRAAAMNNGDYLNKFYKSMPIAKWGNTTINISSPLTDEEKLYIPLVDYATQQALLTDKAQQAGLMPLDPVPDGADALKRTFVGTLIPDIMNNRANPFAAVTMDLLMSWVTNPFDTYRGREIYNRDLWTARNASWADRWAFFKETIKRTAIDTGANSVIRLDRFDVDDGEEAPAAVMTSLRKIPVVSAVASSAFRLSTNGDQYRKRVVDAAFEQENAIKRLRAGDLLRDWIEQGCIDDSTVIGDKLKAWGERYGWDKATQTEVMVKAIKGWQRRLRDIPEYRNAKLFDKIRRSTSPKREMLERWLEMGDF